MDYSDRKSNNPKIKRDKSVQNRNNHFKKLNAHNINNSLIIQKKHKEEKDLKKNNKEIKENKNNKNKLKINSAQESQLNKTMKNFYKKKELNNTKNESSLKEKNKNKNKKIDNNNEIKENTHNTKNDKQKKNDINKPNEIKKVNKEKQVNKVNKVDDKKKINKDIKQQKKRKSEIKENKFETEIKDKESKLEKDMIVNKKEFNKEVIDKKDEKLNENKKNKIKELNAQIDLIKKENNDSVSMSEKKAKTQIPPHKKENNDSISKYEIKIKELNSKNSLKKENNNDSTSKYENKINLLKDEINSLKKDNNDLTSRNEELETELINLQTQIKKLNEQLQKIKKVNPFILYSSPTLIGLNNIGATCFMNSTLQCLSQTKALTYFFLNENNKDRIINNNIALENKNNNQLSPIYLELIQKLWEIGGPKSFSPKTFMNIVEKMNPLFKQGQAGDAKDFIIFILEQLHKELKQSNNIIIQNENQALNQYNKNNALNYFFNDFKKDGSIISDLFFGFNETTNECLNCKNIYNSQNLINPICYNYGIFNCLVFPLEEVKNWKNNSMQYNNMQINNNRVSLYDCFSYNQKADYFTGENRNYCNICKQLYDSIYISKIFVSPNILVLILNRGKGNIYDVKLDFSEIIDITQFVEQKDVPQLIYNLYGVITHIGESGPNAHFVASCKSPIDNKWYRYNDAFVNPITNIQKEIFEFGTPYILFYQKN